MTDIESPNGTHGTEAPVFIIEDGIPIPPNPAHTGRTKSALRRAIDQLNVGQSFFIAVETEAEIKTISTRVSAAGRAGAGCKYARRTVPGGVRVWHLT